MYWKHGKLLKVKNHNGYHQLEKKKKNLPVWYAASAAISERPTAVIQVVSSFKYSCCFEVICKFSKELQTTQGGLSTFQ